MFSLRWFLTFTLLFLGLQAVADVNSMWRFWRQGDMAAASQEAQRLVASHSDQAHHVLMLTSFAQGKFQEAIAHQKRISTSYPRFRETLMPVIDAQKHLGQYADASAFAVQHSFNEPMGLQSSLRRLAKNPPKFVLQKTTEIPFKKDDPYNPYLPAFDMSLNGRSLVGHLDTGGTFVVISKELADQMGLKMSYLGKGHCNNREASVWTTLAHFQMGDLLVQGVPTEVSDCLNGTAMRDRVIFGTNVLQRFLSTIDYPGDRLVLSPFNRRVEHFKRISSGYRQVASQPFYIWADHYMFTKGQLSGAKNLNFFVDTGLVYFHADGRQAAFLTSTKKLIDMGYDSRVLAQSKVVDALGDIGLSEVVQSGHVIRHQDEITFGDFGGVEISGLIAHAFLRSYSWTIDFERMSYSFLKPVQRPKVRDVSAPPAP